jgi:hypothetical protein
LACVAKLFQFLIWSPFSGNSPPFFLRRELFPVDGAPIDRLEERKRINYTGMPDRSLVAGRQAAAARAGLW